MPIEKLSKKDLENRAGSGGHPEYIAFLKAAKAGEGGRLIVADEGKSRQTIKARIKTAAKITGRNIKFLRSPATEVVVQVVE